MKALAFYETQDNPICCRCALNHANEGGYPHLYFASNKPRHIPSDVLCDCGCTMGSVNAQEAAKTIAKMLDDG